MSLHLEWVFTCCVCKKVERERAETAGLICDSDPVPVRQPSATGWETDGIGGWMCSECHRKWKSEGSQP